MEGDVSIDVGSAVPYLMESVKGWFGKDAFTLASKERFEKQFRIAVTQASHVQCVGMWKPIPINQIYQHTRLKTSPFTQSEEKLTIWDLLEKSINAVILAGPGDGKTVLMHWFLSNLVSRKEYLPMLFTLRLPDAVDDLSACIKDISIGKCPHKNKKNNLVLLVDGYDEISEEQRKTVSHLLMVFASLKIGNFFLTCRTHYSIYNLPVDYFWIDSFSKKDAFGFAKSFLKAYGVRTNPQKMLKELYTKGFQSFAEHPLLLALVCILQSTPLQGLPRSSLGLLRRAIDTLTLRWDESRGIARDSRIPLDGEERVRCLMRIAYNMSDLISPFQQVIEIVREHFTRQQLPGIDTRRFLQELAQWYGLLVPVSEDSWGFSHRTIHDFLAARYWVESGTFYSTDLKTWDARAAYAMCIVPDATLFLKQALAQRCEFHIITQCLINNAIFDPNEISWSIIVYFKHEKKRFTLIKSEHSIISSLDPSLDFFRDASVPLLEAIILAAIREGTDNASDLLLSYSLFEFMNRGFLLRSSLYSQILQYFKFSKFSIQVMKGNAIKVFLIDEVKRN